MAPAAAAPFPADLHRARGARPGGSRCVTLSARSFLNKHHLLRWPRGRKRRKKGQKREVWPQADAAKRVRGFRRAGRAPGEAARGWWPGWELSPSPSPRCWRYLPSSSPRGSTSSGGSTGIGCGGAGRSGSRGWTCREDRADVAPGSTATSPPGSSATASAGALGHGPAASSRCHAAPVHTLTHTHTRSPARRCYGNRDRELFPTGRAEGLCFQQCPGVWESRRSPRGTGGAPQREEKRGAGGSHPRQCPAPPSRGRWLEAGVAPAARGIPTISYGAAGLGCPCGHGRCGAGSWGPPLCAGQGDAPQCPLSSLRA